MSQPTIVAPLTAARSVPARAGLVRRVVTDTTYVLAMFPYGLVSFVLLVAGFSVGIALLFLVGMPVFTGTLYLARGFAEGERRAAARVIDVPAAPVRYKWAAAGSGRWRRMLTSLADGQYWLEFGHGLLVLVTGTIAFVFVVVWWAGALGGTLYVLWGWALPDNGAEDQRLHELLGLPDIYVAEVGLNTVIGLIFLAALPLITRAAALVRAAPAKGMLFAVAGLRERISGLEEERATARAQTAAAVSAEATALRRLERDIHDGPQQRLVRLAMDLSRAQYQLDSDPQAARATVAEALSQTRETLGELRALSRGIAPPILADRGLVAAVAALAGRSTVPVDVDSGDLGRLGAAVENVAYFVIAESLTNVAKHSLRHTECTIALRRTVAGMWIEIRDDGVGGAHVAKGHGLAGLVDRVRAAGGTLAVHSPLGGPTAVTAVLPCG